MKSKDKRNISDHLNEYDFKKLKIKFLNKDEIKIFSTLCQDGIFSIDEIIYNKSDKILIATFSRFCWEFVEKKIKNETFYRVVSGIRICNVNKITYTNKDKINSSKFINLLSVDYDKNELTLNFSLDVTIKLFIEKIEIYLDDLDMPWPTGKKPMHK
ncbi:MAG: DUF2948 family protein [Alphaproteobacteria bacterium]|nr:MAG: DUF2948 family protein [Alphaproteobacteria bacterium]